MPNLNLIQNKVIQTTLVGSSSSSICVQPKQLLKWVGNKHNYAKEIISFFPLEFNKYIEPFIGTGALLGCLQPKESVAGDILEPLIGLWELVQRNPKKVIEFYSHNYYNYMKNPNRTYEMIKQSYNLQSNSLDLLFISRTCYGGVMRFTRGGKISTPRGPHKPIPPSSFEDRLLTWHRIIRNTSFFHQSFEKTMNLANEGDVVYCDPPYIFSQSILYGAQTFNINDLWVSIYRCKQRGAKVILSIDGLKKSGKMNCDVQMPTNLFEREVMIDCGKSMLRRFQKRGESLTGEDIHDRLLLTW